MRRVLWMVLAGASVTAGTWFLAGLPGTVALRIASYTISAATPVAVLATAIALVLLYWLFRVLGALVSFPATWRSWRTGRNRRIGDKAVTRVLVALAAGQAGSARQEARRALRALGPTPQTLLLAAEADIVPGRYLLPYDRARD